MGLDMRGLLPAPHIWPWLAVLLMFALVIGDEVVFLTTSRTWMQSQGRLNPHAQKDLRQVAQPAQDRSAATEPVEGRPVMQPRVLPDKATPYFYIYDSAAMMYFKSPPCEVVIRYSPSYIYIAHLLMAQLEKHPWRVYDPEQAKWFIVPFNFDWNVRLGTCNGTTRTQRSNAVLDELEASPYYRRSNGSDHAMLAMSTTTMWVKQKHFKQHRFGKDYVTIPDNRRPVVRQMVVGSFVDLHFRVSDPRYGFSDSAMWYHYETADWRCTWLLPVNPIVWRRDESFEEWRDGRKTLIFFRGKGAPCHSGGKGDRVSVLRKAPMRLTGTVPNVIASKDHAETIEQYEQEITHSKFCLVLRCDDPQTSRLIDSLAAGCIPVIINDWATLMAKPFPRLINWDAFTITLPEEPFIANPAALAHFIYTIDATELRYMVSALQEARRHLLWNHPQSDVGTMALQELESRCAPAPA